MRNFKIIGLTGPTGSGKSTVSFFFKKNGYIIINADELAKKALMPGSSCLKQICGIFGKDILNPDRTLNRKKLADRAFLSKETAQLLNDITHPWIFLQVMRLCRDYIDSGNNKIVFDAPLLFESRSEIMCDYVISVLAPKEIRLQRLQERDGLSRQQLEKRMNVQHSDEFYRHKSDFVIDGSKSLSEIATIVDNICSNDKPPTEQSV